VKKYVLWPEEIPVLEIVEPEKRKKVRLSVLRLD
jgi:hypothetical protein